MKNLCGLSFFALGLLLPGPPGWAMSYVPMSDEALLAQADVAVAGTVADAIPAPGQERDATEYGIAVTDAFKGRVSEAPLRIRVPGGLDPDANGALIVPGVPHFAKADKVLLFLNQAADGSYTITQLMLGAFHYRESSEGETLLDQDLSQAEAMVNGDGVPYRRYRQAPHFEQWLRDKTAGLEADAAYWSAAVNLRQQKYALTDPLGRWFEFDQGLTVPVYASMAGQSGLSSGGYPELQQALDAWNNAGDLVSLAYEGKSSASGGLGYADGVTEVLFNDPNNEISGIFDCVTGGIGAYAKWRGGATRMHKGQLYRAITEGDIVVQDGIGCLLSTGKNKTQELLAHELGHLLGLDHSCGDGLLSLCAPGTLQDDALMRPTLHGDGRGAHLNADDLAGLAHLYGDADGSGSAATAAPPADSSGGGSLGISLLLVFSIFGARGLHRPLQQTQ